MKRIDYEKPTTEVVDIQEHEELLTGTTGVTGYRDDYGDAIETEWGP